MKKIVIRDEDGKVIDRIKNFPETLEEVSLSQFTSFEAAIADRDKSIAEWGEDITSAKFMKNYIEWTLKVLSEFLNKDVEDYPLGNWLAHIQKISQSKEFDYEGIEGNLLSLLANVYNLIDTYEQVKEFEQDYKFKFKGKKYVVKGADRDSITGKLQIKNIPAAQVLEALRISDVYAQNRKNDPNGNFFFTSLLYAIACFARRPKESFPDEQSKITQHVNDRVKLFEEIDMKTGLDVAAFFLHTSDLRKTIKTNSFFGMLQLEMEKTLKK